MSAQTRAQANEVEVARLLRSCNPGFRTFRKRIAADGTVVDEHALPEPSELAKALLLRGRSAKVRRSIEADWRRRVERGARKGKS
jgi:hypothetical protein